MIVRFGRMLKIRFAKIDFLDCNSTTRKLVEIREDGGGLKKKKKVKDKISSRRINNDSR